MSPERALAAMLIAAMAASATTAVAQAPDEPVGWPWRPEPGAAADKESAPTVKESAPADKADVPEQPPEAPGTAMPDAGASPDPGVVAPDAAVGWPLRRDQARPRVDAGIGVIDRFDLPIAPIEFAFESDRTTLTRTETQALDRLAIRLRGRSDAVTVIASAPEGRDHRRALRSALIRALAVRLYLLRQGVREDQIEAVAELAEGTAAARLVIRPVRTAPDSAGK